ncbi:MAG: hydrogenase maturation nickel metallochaperone HypA, partial [Candidatus Zixiibacteriota bacterium]
MHELSIAVNIMEAVQQQLPAADQARLKAIGLRIGELTDVVPEALTFGFE